MLTAKERERERERGREGGRFESFMYCSRHGQAVSFVDFLVYFGERERERLKERERA